ncbi:MAG: ergothioneine biosynthesis protein EgtB [Xanthomonadales bacterium]|nr:ergothioneine biosynthesis protein EgtB [Xanthomonadales bacterium]
MLWSSAVTERAVPRRRKAIDTAFPAQGDDQHPANRFREVRRQTLILIEGLGAEDLCAQSMTDASPGKWHLAHTTWFFEVMLLQPLAGLQPLHPDWLYLFNSYYEALGERHPRPQRGLLTRPTIEEVLTYRKAVEARVQTFLDALDPQTGRGREALAVLELGLNHEQQHQELLVTDIKHLLSHSALQPAWRSALPQTVDRGSLPKVEWLTLEAAGTVEVGADGIGFAFDNERPRHRVWLEPLALASRPVSCGEYIEFIEAGGYRDPQWWLSDGWAAVQSEAWKAPLYWRRDGKRWLRFSNRGLMSVDPREPVCHLSYFEADAYARFRGARLPTEAEWEHLAGQQTRNGEFADSGRLEPAALAARSFGGNVWEWTQSPYAPYPGFKPLPGAAGEYNGKFMCSQMVLRGGSCATPKSHIRPSYRNFFPPAARWQFSGLRLARDLT